MELLIILSVAISLLAVHVDGRSSCVRITKSHPCQQFYFHFDNEGNTFKNQSNVFNVTAKLSNSKRESFEAFFCVVFYPPCGASVDYLLPNIRTPHVVPCQEFCTSTWKLWRRMFIKKKIPQDSAWPWGLRCESLPRKDCIKRSAYGTWKYLHKHSKDDNVIPILRDDDDEIDDKPPRLTSEQIIPRRYDVIDQGNSKLFRGWADVQGTGAANDYCRVIGKRKKQFLACALAGSVGQDHRYVSRMGFDAGLKDTWYMRDANNDGRDDYCRCVGNSTVSRISCMKAERDGFRSSPLVGGSQYSFDLIGSDGCFGQEVNPFTGL
ncbi:uncharacterized protein LOC110453926 [Mizuhopecten yessoensis]|uniref:FZ domain-containing protein n=1 Tax=Mizuhopecten yessoensis TaxID=6573 RepID=A0A210QGC1_MIZYE|nr:uncharacterized protein LOC110453926 [Mizuhopecten yessoensis]OWF47794.1 hypothetical protein KP79_PYT06198 [Mizuhopecten yessoensis]